MFRRNKKSLEEDIADLQVPDHVDGANRADAQDLIDTVRTHFQAIPVQMRQAASKAQEINVLGHIASIAAAGVKYGVAVAEREAKRALGKASKRSPRASIASAPAREVDSAREGRLAENLGKEIKRISDGLRAHYIKIFDARPSG